MFRISQGQLNVLTTCPRKFQYTYIEELGTPYTAEQQEKIAWGSKFHLLMQQQEIGLPIESIAETDTEIKRSVNAFIDTTPELFPPAQNSDFTFRQAEHPRTLIFQNYLITVIYDLLIAEQTRAQILDWKTYPRPQNHELLAENWQTRLYLYVLAETSNYLPEQISMTYWFVQLKSETTPQKSQFNYTEKDREKTRQDLAQIFSKLTAWLDSYYEQGEPFPQVKITDNKCQYCQFITRCDRHQETTENSLTNITINSSPDWFTNIDIIEEISI
ncbi:PD-(D/E)XK nuclease superfamily protein [Oscillatoriales cyanobacterium USR001]|nr:PD-(D/E)XK nuclease superfamily protein [Oscillatoriales cyanobacterium USR001]